jgi:hypothetical protein
MRSVLSICAVLILATPLGGCLEVALLGLNLLANGTAAPAMKQTGPMAESVGQQTVQQALGLIDTGTLAICRARNETAGVPADEHGTTTTDVSSPKPQRGRCELRPVCLPGFDEPVTMQVCERTDDTASVQADHQGPNSWAWEGARSGDLTE